MPQSRHTPLAIAFRRPWPGTRRGLCLWLFAISFMIIGYANYVGTDLPDPTENSLAFALSVAPAWFWGWCMVTAGTAAVVSAYCHFGRDRYGFTLLATFCGVWALGYLCGFLFYDAGLRAVSGSVIWFLFTGILALIAGFPNVPLNQPVAIRIEEPGGDR